MRERVHIGRGPGRALRLEAGSHDSPGDGVCIVELASVIAGEPFSDHPRCVCKVIAAFLRSWNDRASHSARQRLLPYAERVVGSRAARRAPPRLRVGPPPSRTAEDARRDLRCRLASPFRLGDILAERFRAPGLA